MSGGCLGFEAPPPSDGGLVGTNLSHFREPPMSPFVRVMFASLSIGALACSQAPRQFDVQASAGIDSLNSRLVRAYRTRDPQAYAALYTDTAIFEWPAFNTVRGPTQLAAMARSNWASLADMDLRLIVSS